MAYQMVATAVTLNEGHSPVAGHFKCNPSGICAAFTRFQVTMCLHGPSALTELLVMYYDVFAIFCKHLSSLVR